MPTELPDSVIYPWHIQEAHFPKQGTLKEQLEFLLNYAILAPSSHNTQPWKFTVHKNSIALYLDRSRSLPVADPNCRELVISCGAALFNLSLAVRHLGYCDRVELVPDPNNTDLLAVIHLGDWREPTPAEERLFQAIPHRHTDRTAYADRSIAESTVAELEAAVRAENARLFVLNESQRLAVADLVAAGDRIQGSDRAFRQELGRWVHANCSPKPDGMPGYAFGFGDWMSRVGAFVLQQTNWGKSQANRDRQKIEDSSALAVITTGGDSTLNWLMAGQALERMLLCAQTHQIHASFLNQPIQVEGLRSLLKVVLDADDYPQVLVRLGYGSSVVPTPRRAIEAVMGD